MTTSDDQQVCEGYLLLADISGYTAFLTGTELEHAQAIIRELTKLIRSRVTPPMKFVKLEGDAVFCYADGAKFRDGERFVELIEVCHFDFSNRLQDMTRSTTCRCDACRAIPSLGLKFVAHYGSFMVESDDGREDLAGPDVILVHRLLKNSVSEGGGPQAYALFTDACLKQMPAWLNLPGHNESYESFGEVACGVHDLDPILEARRVARVAYLSAAEPISTPALRHRFRRRWSGGEVIAALGRVSRYAGAWTQNWQLTRSRSRDVWLRYATCSTR